MPKSIAAIGRFAPVIIGACLSTGALAQDPASESEPPVTTAEAQPAAEPVAPEATAEPEADTTTTEAAVPSATDSIPVAETIALPEAAPAPVAAEAGQGTSDQPTQLEDVVVTATKRQKTLRDIPASISEFNGDKLEEQGKLNLTDYLQSAPGVTLTAIAPNFPRISIRGISTDTNGLASIPSPTGIFIGDTAFSDPYISNIQPDLSAFDLQSVEVLKGPQGTLFGGAALAGAIRYVLQEPVLGEFQARGFTQYVAPDGGSTALTSGVAVNVPLYKDQLALRVGYVKRNYPGYTDLPDHNPPEEDVDAGDGDQLRALLLWQPMEQLRIKFTHLSQDYHALNSTNTSSFPDRREKEHQILPSPVTSEFVLDSLEGSWDFESSRVVSLTSYTTKDASVASDATATLIGPPPAGYPRALTAFLAFDDNSKAFAQEVRWQSTGDGDFQWLAGAYYFDYSVYFLIVGDLLSKQNALGNGGLVDSLLNGVNIDLNLLNTLNNKTSLIYALSQPSAQERALFFDLSDKFFDKLEVSVGARVYSTLVEGGFFGTGVLAIGSNNGQDVHYENNSIKENGVSPKFTATWHFDRDRSLYLQAARGFRFGGLQSVPSTPISKVPQVYKSDSLWNYEVGFRSRWLERTLQADLTAFKIDFKNPQINQATQGLPLNYVDNVGSAESIGLESSLRWLTPVPGLSLSLDGALTDAKVTTAFTASDGTEVPVGSQMPGSAKSQYSAGAAFLAPIGIAALGASVNYNYIGKGYSDLVHSVAINDYGTLNAGLTIGTDAWALRPLLAFNVSNILDTTAVVAGGTGKSITQIKATTYSLNAPRTFSVRLSLAF